jgi:RecA-family ATPase
MLTPPERNERAALIAREMLGIGGDRPSRLNADPRGDELSQVSGPDRDDGDPGHIEYPESAGGDPVLDAPAMAGPLVPLITPVNWRGIPIPPMRWLAANRIPAGDVTILSGDGGGGKTTTALQLAVSVADGLGDWLGTTCEAGPVIFFSAEEPENEMRRRLVRVAKKRGIEPDEIQNLYFHFAEPDKCTLGTGKPTSPIAPTPLFESLRQSAKEIRPALIVVDSNAATLGGNYLDRVHARTFVSLFRQLAREVDCSVLLLDHPSLSGMTNGTGRAGNMDWQNAVRALLYLRSCENEQGATSGRELEVMKSNYGPRGEKQKLRWEDGCYVLEGSASAPHQAAAFNAADQNYLDCLDAATVQGRNVFPMPGKGHAPKVFADMPQAKGMTWNALAKAQERLFAAGKIGNVPFGAPSKGTKRIERLP